MTDNPAGPWTTAPLVVIDLEGTGAQDRDDEAILEIAVVPLVGGRPSLADAFSTLINPGRSIPRKPWISPGLTDRTLADAPTLDQVVPELAARLDGSIIVGHNVNVDWRLLHLRCPSIEPAGLIDTLRLARRVHPTDKQNSLTALLDRHKLTPKVTALAPSSQPHRALWDTLGTALLLYTLIADLAQNGNLPLDQLQHFAGVPLERDHPADNEPEQLPLLDL
jgi:DNA polymerase-3 subunit epsilon